MNIFFVCLGFIKPTSGLKSGWILTGSCTCMAGYEYILKFPFQVFSWMFSKSVYNYSRKREAYNFIDLLALWVFLKIYQVQLIMAFQKLIRTEAVQSLTVIS